MRSASASVTSSALSDSSDSDDDDSSSETSSESEEDSSDDELDAAGSIQEKPAPLVGRKNKTIQVRSTRKFKSKSKRAHAGDQGRGLEASSAGVSGETSSEVDDSRLSQVTLNSFLKGNQAFHSVNIMIQMEYCSGESLEKYLRKRNSGAGHGFVDKGRGGSSTGVINRR